MLKCWKCGSTDDVQRNAYGYEEFVDGEFQLCEVVQRCYCKDCLPAVSEQYKKDVQEYIRLKKKLMFERAVRILEGQTQDIYDYHEAIRAVEEFAREKPDKFDSAYEMVAAIVLVDNEIGCELQRKVGRYQCDFYIPSLKVVLEIDGERHKYNKGYDSKRDHAIMKELGSGWNVVRIKTDYLDKNADLLVEAIKTIVAERNEQKRKAKAFRESYK